MSKGKENKYICLSSFLGNEFLLSVKTGTLSKQEKEAQILSTKGKNSHSLSQILNSESYVFLHMDLVSKSKSFKSLLPSF